MTNWTKVKRQRGGGREARTTTAVRRSRTGNRAAVLVLPAHIAVADRAEVYSDGNGKLAFSFGGSGTYSVREIGACHSVAIPEPHNTRIPFGTTDVSLTNDGGMLVLDLSQL